MNILIIGNGFDLAHNLPTSYKDFLVFCNCVCNIYSSSQSKTTDEYVNENFKNKNINDNVKEHLLNAFNNRIFDIRTDSNNVQTSFTRTSNDLLNEFYSNIENNAWINYFLECETYIGENWIDFESEISKVIKSFDVIKNHLQKEKHFMEYEGIEGKTLMQILKASKSSMNECYGNINTLIKFSNKLSDELDKLVRALEIYLDSIINNITLNSKIKKFDEINFDCVLSFNYSNTFERVYTKRKTIQYDYIHGKALSSNSIITNNMVLGIDEYLPDNKKNNEIEFITFKKYYQRIYKSTGNEYKGWIEKIEKDEKAKRAFVCDGKDHSKDNFHYLYVYGHSLDVTDKDILREFILHNNVETTIFYYEKFDENGNGDNGRGDLKQKIANLVKVIGQDELITRTGGKTKTIYFELSK